MPMRVFMYTLDQIATMLCIEEKALKQNYLHYIGRSVGVRPPDRMEAKNIAPEGQPTEWRVVEREFIRWLRYKGFRVYSPGYTSR